MLRYSVMPCALSNGLIAVAGLFATAVVVWAMALWTLQRSVLFPDPPAPAVSPATGRTDIEVMWLGEDSTEAWYLPPRGRAAGSLHDDDRPAPVLVFTHGNGELIDMWLDPFEHARDWGLGVLLVEYPGYGRSGGSPSEESIARTMSAVWNRLSGRPDIDATRIIAWGRSLGGGAACSLAGERDVAALILESSFTSVRSLARRFGLFGPLVRDPFDNLGVVENFGGPLLVLHGERDAIIPAKHGKALAAAGHDSELQLLPCGHNDCPTQWRTVREFLIRRHLLP